MQIKSKYPMLGNLSSELGKAELGDKRLSSRLGQIVDSLSHRPGDGFPTALGSSASLEGFYRFLSNERVSYGKILWPHICATVERVRREKRAIIVHDTTTFQFGGLTERKGLGATTTQKKGFYGHFALAVSGLESKQPLGVLGIHTYCRTGKKYKSNKKTASYKRLCRQGKVADRESLRWGTLVQETENQLKEYNKAIHVMDREADYYDLFAKMYANSHSFVIRLAQKRKLYDGNNSKRGGADLFKELEQFPDVLEREVPLSARPTSAPYYRRGRYPVRRHRIAKLRVAAKTVPIKRPSDKGDELPFFLSLQVVRVYEADPPKGEEPIEWVLVTTEPINTKEDVDNIVDIYRCRWIIEEFFKALKTGCAFEKRQLESYSTLLNVLAILVPVAWRLLLLRGLSRSEPDSPASKALSLIQIKILKRLSNKRLPKKPTVEQAMMAIAQLGGHIKNNGPPGWMVLGRGYQEIITIERWIGKSGENL